MTNWIVAALTGGGAGIALGIVGYALIGRAKGSTATTQALQIKDTASKEAEHLLREAKVAAKAEVLQMKETFEKELKERRKEQSAIEKRLNQREETLDKKLDTLESRADKLEKTKKDLDVVKDRVTAKEEDLQKNISRQIDELERIATLDREEAKTILFTKLESEVKNEAGILMRGILEETKHKAEKEAQKILAYAIQRYSSDCTSERTTATIPLPNDEMKGRIIGREGRNIRAIESATGVNVLIDDTPEAVVISCFDPVRKEIARLLMERLIADGRIHPTRIEELLKKVTKEIEDELLDAGEKAVLDANVKGVPTQIVKLIGRLKYRYSFSQNVLKHSLETSYFMGMIAAELGLDEQKAKRIGLFHDLGKALDHEIEGSHAKIGADILRKHGEAKDVINAVAAHHGEVEAGSVYAILANACDALSASRPGARSETTELYLKRLEQLEAIAHDFKGVESCYALQAGREIRVVVEPNKIQEGEAQTMARDICQRIEKEMNYPGQIKVAIIRETRTVHYAK